MPWIKKGQAHCSGNTESYNQAKFVLTGLRCNEQTQ